MKDFKIGEQVRFDYGSTLTGQHWSVPWQGKILTISSKEDNMTDGESYFYYVKENNLCYHIDWLFKTITPAGNLVMGDL